ncbi:hypothetical protein FA95DRAFT_1649566 [Auriscalpium vulgare]|uniref:Uncharacterized protein n=1 Tax=Auriscalpium vulgare TaxID=40419 RepID=A0ACB8R8K7_9AGAM|nr:hypothetical protein FA95DRAFT_1649566 [Auriscalpium vulgare]
MSPGGASNPRGGTNPGGGGGGGSNPGGGGTNTGGTAPPPQVIYARHMPIPRTSSAPSFDGKYVSDFLVLLQQHGRAAGLTDNELATRIYQYCSDEVKDVIRYCDEFKTPDWAAATTLLKGLYGASDEPVAVSIAAFQLFCKQHAERARFSTRLSAELYHRKFLSMSAQLRSKGLLTDVEQKLWFYRGLPREARVYVTDHMDAQYLTITNPPPMADVLALVNRAFDPNSIEAWGNDIRLEDDDRDDDTDLFAAPKKSVRFDTTTVAGAEPLDPQQNLAKNAAAPNAPSASSSADVDAITRRLEELSISLAQLRSLQASGGAPASQGNSTTAGGANLSDKQDFPRRCFMCGQTGTHRLHIRHCPETASLVEAGLVLHNYERNRYVLPDGSDLPQAPYGDLANYIRRLASMGKITPATATKTMTRDTPPHQVASTSSVGLVVGDRDVLHGDVYALASQDEIPRASFYIDADYNVHPVTRSGKDTAARDKSAPYTRTKPPDTSAPSQVRPNIPPAHSQPPRASQQVPQTQPQAPRTIVPPNAPPAPAINTQNPARKSGTDKGDVVMKDAERRTPQYHFTSDIQEQISLEKIEKTIWDQPITLPLRELVGVSALLQKRIAEVTKTRREYVTSAGEYELYSPEAERRLAADGEYAVVAPGCQLNIDEPQELEDFLVAHSNALSIRPVRYFAMTTGIFTASMAGKNVALMVDTGSELNLIPERLVSMLGLPLDYDGSRWALKGVHGDAVRLLGCCKDVELSIGGHSFDHHFFVSSTEPGGKFDVILGQPWIQYFAARIDYERQGMVITLWKDGDRNEKPTLSLTLTRPNERNADRLPSNSNAHAHSTSARWPPQESTTRRSAWVEEVPDEEDFRQLANTTGKWPPATSPPSDGRY